MALGNTWLQRFLGGVQFTCLVPCQTVVRGGSNGLNQPKLITNYRVGLVLSDKQCSSQFEGIEPPRTCVKFLCSPCFPIVTMNYQLQYDIYVYNIHRTRTVIKNSRIIRAEIVNELIHGPVSF